MTKAKILPLSVQLYLKMEIVSEYSPTQTVLMNLWTEVLTNPAEFILPNSTIFLSTTLFVFFQTLYLTHRMHIDNPIEFCPTNTENVSIMVRKKWQIKTLSIKYFPPLKTSLWTCRLWLWQPRLECFQHNAENVFFRFRKRNEVFFFLETISAQNIPRDVENAALTSSPKICRDETKTILLNVPNWWRYIFNFNGKTIALQNVPL